jgi:hypothetical protein
MEAEVLKNTGDVDVLFFNTIWETGYAIRIHGRIRSGFH